MGDSSARRSCTLVLGVAFLAALVGVPVYFLHLRGSQTAPTPCHEGLSVPLLNPVRLPDGSVDDGGQVYPPDRYFTSNGTFRGCLCSLTPCIRKCCAPDEQYVKRPQTRATCETRLGHSPFDNVSLPVYKATGESVTVGIDQFRVVYGDVCRNGKYSLDENEKYYLLEDGRFKLNWDSTVYVSDYCLESQNGSQDIRFYVCLPDSEEDVESRVVFSLYPIAMIVSLPFLLATIIVYSVLPGLRNLHGKSLVCQCSCLLIGYIATTYIYLSADAAPFWCVFFAFMSLFGLLGSFFWLNVISFDIWWSFSGLRPAKWALRASDEKKFLFYSLYAWGMPTVILVISVSMDVIPGIPDSFIKPGIGMSKCWFSDWTGALVYFYLPSGIVLVINTLMFVTTALKLRSQIKSRHEHIRFHLFLKLFIVMGLNWLFELISFLVGGPKSIWFVTDLTNILQGVFIFFFFVWDRDILKKLNKKFCPQWNLFGETPPENSKSSNSLTKTEVDIIGLPLKSMDDSAENQCAETHQQATTSERPICQV